MTDLLRLALSRVEALPAETQDAIATRLIAELEDERRWDERFAATSDDQWDAIAAQVRGDVASNGVRPLDDVLTFDEPGG